MKKMRMCFPREKTFADGFGEYILDCKARNLRDGRQSNICFRVTVCPLQVFFNRYWQRTNCRSPGKYFLSSWRKSVFAIKSPPCLPFWVLQHTEEKRKRAVVTMDNCSNQLDELELSEFCCDLSSSSFCLFNASIISRTLGSPLIMHRMPSQLVLLRQSCNSVFIFIINHPFYIGCILSPHCKKQNG